MRYAIVSKEGDSLWLWARLQDEGHDVAVHINPAIGMKRGKPERHIGHGIVPKYSSRYELDAWASKDAHNTTYIFDSSGLGDYADEMRKRGFAVVGGGGFCDQLEHKRVWAMNMCKQLGIKMPEQHAFGSVSEAIDWLRSHQKGDKKWYWKTDKSIDASKTYGFRDVDEGIRYLQYIKAHYADRMSNVIQEKIEGVALSTSAWFNGLAFIPPFEGTIEHKKFMNDDKGPSTGCSMNIVWMYQDEMPYIARKLKWDALGGYFRASQAPAGLYDINAVISEADGEPYFLEFTPRFGYDSEPTAQKLCLWEYAEFMWSLPRGRTHLAPFTLTDAAMSVRLTVPPCPWEHSSDDDRNSPFGLPVEGLDGLWDGFFVAYGIGTLASRDDAKLGVKTTEGFANPVTPFGTAPYVVKDPQGIVGLSATTGESISTMAEAILNYADELKVPNLQYRTDIAKALTKDVQSILNVGYPISPVVRP